MGLVRTKCEYNEVPLSIKEKILDIHKAHPEYPHYVVAKYAKCRTYMVKAILEVEDDGAHPIRDTKSMFDEKEDFIREQWETGRVTKVRIAEQLHCSVGALSRWMVEHGMGCTTYKEQQGFWEKSVEEIINETLDPIREETRIATLEELGLGINVEGQKMYDVSQFFGVEYPNIVEKQPDWKVLFHRLGIVNYGKEYGEFGCDSHKRAAYHKMMNERLRREDKRCKA